MRLNRAPMTALLLLAAVAAVQVVHYYPLLPDDIAVHFSVAGEPNGWDTKGGFMLTYSIIEALVIGLGLAFVFMMDRIPAGFINIPHREYWLAPVRQKETAEFLGNQVLWIEVATLAFLIVVAQFVYMKNLGDAPPRFSGELWYLMAAFIAITLWISARIVLRFRTKGPDGPAQP